MIGLTNKTGKICEHVNTLVEHKNTSNHDMKELKQAITEDKKEIEASRVVIDKLYNEVEELKKNIVSNEDIEELVTDIRSSFELFVNNTPRPDDTKMQALEARINALNQKFEEMGFGDDVEIIKKVNSKGIPKLNIKRK